MIEAKGCQFWRWQSQGITITIGITMEEIITQACKF
jgi:hypothetical protein